MHLSANSLSSPASQLLKFCQSSRDEHLQLENLQQKLENELSSLAIAGVQLELARNTSPLTSTHV